MRFCFLREICWNVPGTFQTDLPPKKRTITHLIVNIPAHWLVRFCFWAADLLERAVYALETACHPGFLGGMGGGQRGGGDVPDWTTPATRIRFFTMRFSGTCKP